MRNPFRFFTINLIIIIKSILNLEFKFKKYKEYFEKRERKC